MENLWNYGTFDGFAKEKTLIVRKIVKNTNCLMRFWSWCHELDRRLDSMDNYFQCSHQPNRFGISTLANEVDKGITRDSEENAQRV